MLPAIQEVLATHSVNLEFQEMDIADPSLGFFVDTLELFPKAGFVAVDIWHPAIQGVGPMTDAADSASQAGSIDCVVFRDSDFGLPLSYNVAFSAATRTLARHENITDVASVVILGGQVPAGGVGAALKQVSVESVVVVEPEASNPDPLEQALAEAVDAADLVLSLFLDRPQLASEGVIGKTLPDFAESWHVERMRDVMECSTSQILSPEASRDLARVFADRANQIN